MSLIQNFLTPPAKAPATRLAEITAEFEKQIGDLEQVVAAANEEFDEVCAEIVKLDCKRDGLRVVSKQAATIRDNILKLIGAAGLDVE